MNWQTAGQYQVYERLAHDSIAEVFLAQPKVDGGPAQLVILKVFSQKQSEDRQFTKLLTDELGHYQGLTHESLVKVVGYGMMKQRFYVAVENVIGPTLKALVRQGQGQPLPLEAALHIESQILAGLMRVNQHGREQGRALVHGSLTPACVIIGHDGAVKVSELGLASAMAHVFETAPHSIIHTINYMPPEQARAEAVDERTDLYSAAMIFYSIATGKVLTDNLGVRELLRFLQDPSLEPLSALMPTCPPELSTIIMTALAKEPKHRYQSLQAFKMALGDFIARAGLKVNRQQLLSHVEMVLHKPQAGHDELPATVVPRQSWSEHLQATTANLSEQATPKTILGLGAAARHFKLPALAVGLYKAASAKYAQQGALLGAVQAFKLAMELHGAYDSAQEAELLRLRALSGADNVDLSIYTAVDDPATAKFLSETFFAAGQAQEKLAPQKTPLLDVLKNGEYCRLVGLLRRAYYPDSCFVYCQGDLDRRLYFIVRGRAFNSVTAPDGASYYAGAYAAGDVFGEVGFCSHKPRQSTVQAFEGLEVLYLEGDDFERNKPALVQLYELVFAYYYHHLAGALPGNWPLTLRGLPPWLEQKLLALLKYQRVQPGAIITRRGSLESDIYFIYDGTVEVLSEDGSYGGQVQALLVKGSLFGEASAVKDGKRQATVRAGPVGADLFMLSGASLELLFGEARELKARLRQFSKARPAPELV